MFFSSKGFTPNIYNPSEYLSKSYKFMSNCANVDNAGWSFCFVVVGVAVELKALELKTFAVGEIFLMIDSVLSLVSLLDMNFELFSWDDYNIFE